MSDAASAGLDLRKQIARIDRSIAETQKFQDEANKLRAKAGKLSRDRFLAPLVVTAAFFGDACDSWFTGFAGDPGALSMNRAAPRCLAHRA